MDNKKSKAKSKKIVLVLQKPEVKEVTIKKEVVVKLK